MIFYPAIDIKGGACVRLVRGDMAQATTYSDDPAGQARAFVAAGCEWLHVVDLDGAFAGRSVNGDAVADVVAAVEVPVQLGGGIRDMAAVEGWLDEGVERVILGTAAVRDPAFVKTACQAFPGRIAVGVDARDGAAAVEGWAEDSGVEARALALRFEDAGAAAVIYTEIARDGTLEGPNLAAIERLARALEVPLIASGGVGSLADLRALKRLESAGVAGVIVGRALYDGCVDARAARELLGA